ncbi:MAG: class C beta-lactamase-related serine hydrolase [Bacteroidetes bacterium]|nr:MAG: class C beta-lactamase-related serine hydrolase [Bacteroidota bacterium]
MRKKLGTGSAIVAVLIVLIFSGCKVGRFVWYNYSNITDYSIFPARPLHKSVSPFLFTSADMNGDFDERIQIMNYRRKAFSLKSYLEESPTVAFLIIRNDSLLYERYFDGYDKESDVASFSVAKSYISALIGIAIGEGKIKSEDDKVIEYVDELRGREGWDKVTIHHLLQMASGIGFTEKYNTPFSGAAKIYYGRELRNIIAGLKIEKEPMSGFQYQSINTQLLGLILERSTGKRVTEYLDEKIWKPLGMEYDASWSIDKKKDGLEKTFCCINAKARDFAKFGRLYLNKGNWNGSQIVPKEWVEKSTALNTEKGAAWFYNRQWWIGSELNGDFSAIGHLGQYVYVQPKKNLIMVRLGTGRANEDWINVLRQVAEQM